MALKEHAKEQAKSLVGKIGGGIVGLLVASGLMWFTPLIDRFVKPAKPLANFSSEQGDDALSVTFKNLSQNVKQAKWDFGDGSPLEIVKGDLAEVKHKFKQANTYKVKLVVSNVVNQEDTRESMVAVGLKPQILDLSMKPMNQTTKPFTAGVKIKFEATADLDADVEWDFGDGMYKLNKEVMVQEFPLPGKYLVKVRAVMGHSRGAPAIHEIEVLPQSGLVTTGGSQPASSSRGAGRTGYPSTVSVEVAVRSILTADVMKKERLQNVTSRGKVTGSVMQETIKASPGYVIKSPRFETTTLKKSANVINESVMTSDDGKSVIVKAQLTRPGTDYQFVSAVAYVEELDASVSRESKVVTTLPSSGCQLELPMGFKHELEIKYRDQTVVKLNELPIKAFEFSVAGKMYAVTSIKSNGRVTLQMRAVPGMLSNQ